MYETLPLHIVGLFERSHGAGRIRWPSNWLEQRTRAGLLAGTETCEVTAMEFVLLLSIFLTSTGYLRKARYRQLRRRRLRPRHRRSLNPPPTVPLVQTGRWPLEKRGVHKRRNYVSLGLDMWGGTPVLSRPESSWMQYEHRLNASPANDACARITTLCTVALAMAPLQDGPVPSPLRTASPH